jgi:hypothetical protein
LYGDFGAGGDVAAIPNSNDCAVIPPGNKISGLIAEVCF